MKMKYLGLLLLFVIGGDCGKIWFEGDVLPGTNYTVGYANPNNPDESYVADFPAQKVAEVSDSIVSRGLGRLALSLQSVIGSRGKNTVFSPLSIALALALVLLGSKGRTYVEITTALGLSNNTDKAVVEELHQKFGQLFHTLEQTEDEIGRGIVLTLASGVFVQNNFLINQEYIQIARSLYKGEVMSLDFINQVHDSRKIINSWVENRTDGHIKNVLSEPLSLETRVVLVNAIFFQGNWETPFVAEYTRKQKFYTDERNHVEVDMMINVAEAFYYGDDKKKVLGLPYKGRETIMFFVLPTTSDLGGFVASTTPMHLQQMVENSTYVTTIYAVPKMKLEKTIKLQHALERLGVKSLFNPYTADLSNLAEGVYVNNIIQKVEVIVNEKGTTASAATTVDLVRSGGPVVRLDKPFFFFIYDVPSKLVSFWGTVYNPLEVDN